MPRTEHLLLAAAALLLSSAPAVAQIETEDGCVYNREIYPEGTEMCQSGDLVRCEDGSWSPMGDCPNEPMPSPSPGGGDIPDEEDGE
jgi:hypothetical protein